MKKLILILIVLFTSVQLFAQTNDVFFFLSVAGGPPVPVNGASINLTDGAAFDQTITSGANPLGDVFENVPFGMYTYSVSKDCLNTAMGSVNVDANGGMGVSEFVALTEETENDVFFFLSVVGGPPTPVNGASINLTDGGAFDQTITSGANPLGDVFENVPVGMYSYTVSKDCLVTATGSITVACLGGGMGVSEFVALTEETENDVFFFVGSPLTISGATVNMTGPNGYDETLITGNPIGDVFENVPFGVYNYTITKDCFETVTGSVTVECLGGGMGVSVFENPAEIILDLTVTQTGTILTANATGVTYQWIDCATNTAIPGATNQVFEPTDSGSYAVEITDGNCVDISECIEVTVLGTTSFDINNSISIYPNPVRDNLTIDLNVVRGSVSIQIANMAGQIVKKQVITQSDLFDIDLSDISSGMYVVKIDFDSNVFTAKIIKD